MSPVSKTRTPHFLVHNPNIYNPFSPTLVNDRAQALHTKSHFSRLLIFNPRLKNLLSLSLSCILKVVASSKPKSTHPFHSLPLTLLVSILISRGWRTMRPATFHPRVSSTLLSFLSSFLFVSFRLGNYSFRRVAAPSTPSHVEFFFFLSSSAIPRRSQRERTLRFCGFVSRIWTYYS